MSEPIEQPAEGLWSGLRRRKVVQWGIAYVAAAWGLLQGLAYLSTVFQWSAQLQRPVTMAFLVGLPIALVLAWYHGDRGHQRVSGREFAILIVLLLIGRRAVLVGGTHAGGASRDGDGRGRRGARRASGG